MARPLKFGEEMVKQEFRFPKSLVERLRAAARGRGVPVSEIVRRAVEAEVGENSAATKKAA